MKQFIYLYPVKEILDFEINNKGLSEKEGVEVFKQRYKAVLNKCIDLRYRKKGFGINYVIFDGSLISDVVELQTTDRIIKAAPDFKSRRAKREDGKFCYASSNGIIQNLNGVTILRIAGFHMWDCVEKLARTAYERGIDTLVDEDLTEFLAWRINDPDFKPGKYPTYNARNKNTLFEAFLAARKEKPWLWQDY